MSSKKKNGKHKTKSLELATAIILLFHSIVELIAIIIDLLK